MHTYGLYRRGLRHLARRLKDGKPSAITRTAQLFCRDIPFFATVVPMPSHTGRATVMLQVALKMAEMRSDIVVKDILQAEPHEGMYVAKKNGMRMPNVKMHIVGNTTDEHVCVIDNVIDTGATFNAVKRVLHGAELYAIAHTEKQERNNK